jgi:hypothetical protein
MSGSVKSNPGGRFGAAMGNGNGAVVGERKSFARIDARAEVEQVQQQTSELHAGWDSMPVELADILREVWPANPAATPGI